MKLSHTILFSTVLSLPLISPSFSMDQAPEQKPNTPVRQQLGLVPHTFDVDVEETVRGTPVKVGSKSVKVDLAYPYLSIDSNKTRFFFEGEVVLFSPDSPFDYYVTAPLLPCQFGLIHNTENKKSLAFHKYASHGMSSLQPFYEKLDVADPENVRVSLYACAMSQENYENLHKKSYEGKTQIQEMNAIRDFLKATFKISENNIERRYFRNHSTLPDIGGYQQAPTTVGVTKTGALFHTSLIMEDIFGLKNVPLPPELKGEFSAWNELPRVMKWGFNHESCVQVFWPTVRNHFFGVPEKRNNNYGESKFFFSEKLNVPATSLPKMFGLKFQNGRKITGENPFPKK